MSPTGGLDWFEGAIAHPEGVLRDLNTAFGAPTDLVGEPTLLFLTRHNSYKLHHDLNLTAVAHPEGVLKDLTTLPAGRRRTWNGSQL